MQWRRKPIAWLERLQLIKRLQEERFMPLRVIRELLRAQGPLDPHIERELVELRRACFASEDMREGVRAFGEKRPARWKGR